MSPPANSGRSQTQSALGESRPTQEQAITRSAANQSLWAVTAQVAITLCAVVSSIILNRSLHAEGRGQVALIILWPMLLATLLSAGWSPAISTYVSRNPQRARSLWCAGQLAGAAISVLALGIGWFLIPVLLAAHSDCWMAARWFLLLFIPLHNLSLISTTVLEALGRFDLTSQVRVGNVVLTLGMVLALAACGQLAPSSYVVILVVTAALMTAHSVQLSVRHSAGPWRPAWHGTAGYAIRAAPMTWATAAQGRVDQILITTLTAPNPAAFGIYVAGTAVGGLFGPLAVGLSLVLVPESARRPEVDAVALYARMGRALVLVMGLGAVPLAFCARWVLILAYGHEFAGGDVALRASLLAALLSGLLAMGISTLQGMRRPGTATWVGITSLVFSAAGAAMLLPVLGYLGAVCGQALGALAGLLLLRTVLGSFGFRISHLAPTGDELRLLKSLLGKARLRQVAQPQALSESGNERNSP